MPTTTTTPMPIKRAPFSGGVGTGGPGGPALRTQAPKRKASGAGTAEAPIVLTDGAADAIKVKRFARVQVIDLTGATAPAPVPAKAVNAARASASAASAASALPSKSTKAARIAKAQARAQTYLRVKAARLKANAERKANAARIEADRLEAARLTSKVARLKAKADRLKAEAEGLEGLEALRSERHRLELEKLALALALAEADRREACVAAAVEAKEREAIEAVEGPLSCSPAGSAASAETSHAETSEKGGDAEKEKEERVPVPVSALHDDGFGAILQSLASLTSLTTKTDTVEVASVCGVPCTASDGTRGLFFPAPISATSADVSPISVTCVDLVPRKRKLDSEGAGADRMEETQVDCLSRTLLTEEPFDDKSDDEGARVFPDFPEALEEDAYDRTSEAIAFKSVLADEAARRSGVSF